MRWWTVTGWPTVAASSWGESYLRAKRLPAREAKQLHHGIKLMALNAVANSPGDSPAKASAQAYLAMSKLKSANGVRVAVAADALRAAGVDVSLS